MPRRFPRGSFAALVTLWLAAAALAPAGIINVSATVGGQTEQIGSIDVDVGLTQDSGKMEATFTFGSGYGALDRHCDFRWVQFITHDDCKASYGGNDPTLPFIDPPSGGWDYQQGDGGADTDPFYSNSGTGTYAYPNFSARHTEGINSWIDDYPGICSGNGEKTTWETYLVVTGCEDKKFCVLAGFEWTIGTDANGNSMSDGPMTIGSFDTGNIGTAMTNAGFSGWTAATGCDLYCCIPEPAELVLAGCGLLSLVAMRRRAA